MKKYNGFSFSSFQVDYSVIVDLNLLLDEIGGESLRINRQLEHRFRKKEVKCRQQDNDGNDNEQPILYIW